MRIRRLASLFWALCMVVCLITVYYLTENLLKTPSRGSVQEEMKDNVWIHFEDKLKHLESEVNEYHAVVGELKSVVQELLPAKRNSNANIPLESMDNGIKIIDRISSNIIHRAVDQMKCSVKMNDIPNTHIQMLDVYDKLPFDNIDGGPWKQGFKIKYNPQQWNSHHKLKVFIVPHSHNDPGWLKTFEDYYNTQTRSILNNIAMKLSEDTRRKFVWAEISYFSMWWSEASEDQRTKMKKLIQSKQLEIVTGGWVMNDEATSHWISIVQQLTTGHQWLKENLNLKPMSGWSIDPFGHSATQPYLLKLAGINGSLIQRVHYSVKKLFAKDQQLEFRWRQTWDSLGTTDLWTHMMPFYSYDIPHSCGPDPKICCQFDFKRLPGYGISCPWKIAPQAINDRNVNHKAELLLDQWRKKSQLYKTRVLMMPLGDDFRWDHHVEWDAQFNNYEKILDYLNANENLHIEVRFGTLSDYFKAVQAEKSSAEFPILSGDFFTYADRDDHYWSGYYTSRPFYKRMDRILMSYVRAAEIILTLAKSRKDIPDNIVGPESSLLSILQKARQSLALFQHHDGVTGTSRDPVVVDYGIKLLNAVSDCQRVIQQSAYHILVEPTFYYPSHEQVYFDVDDVRRDHASLPDKVIITIGLEAPKKKVVLYNSLTFTRNEVVTFYVSTPYVTVSGPDDNLVDCQVSPLIVSGTKVTEYQFMLSFVANVPAFGMSSYVITAVESSTLPKSTIFSSLSFLNYDGGAIDSGVFMNKVVSSEEAGDFTLKLMSDEPSIVAAFSKVGLLKSIKMPNRQTVPVHLDFRKYGTRQNGDKSGGYLFLPGDKSSIINSTIVSPLITIIEGPILTRMFVQLPYVHHTVNIYSTDNYFIEVSNVVDITSSHNMELVMRLSTIINNNDEFYTDLNGFQMIRRKYFSKIPLQANFYPMPTAAYIEDGKTRLTLLTSTSLGLAALSYGQLEVMMDRRLNQDDNRGMAQGVLDNHPTKHVFRILIETNDNNKCEKPAQNHPAGQLTLGAQMASDLLLNPFIYLLYNSDGHPERSDPDWSQGKNLRDKYAPMSEEPGVDISVASYRDNVLSTASNGKSIKGKGLVIHRRNFNLCYSNEEHIKTFPVSDGQLKLIDMIPMSEMDEVYNSSLSFVNLGSKIDLGSPLVLCPMEVYPYFIH